MLPTGAYCQEFEGEMDAFSDKRASRIVSFHLFGQLHLLTAILAAEAMVSTSHFRVECRPRGHTSPVQPGDRAWVRRILSPFSPDCR